MRANGFSRALVILCGACTRGDRAAADRALRRLAAAMGMDSGVEEISDLEIALRVFGVRLPPTEGDIRRVVEENRMAAKAAGDAELVF